MKPLRLPFLQVQGASLYPSTLLVAKLTWLVLFVHYTMHKFEVPFLPLWPALDLLQPIQYPVSLGLQLIFFLGGVALLCNVQARLACLALGLAMLLLMLGNRTVYRNHLFITACIFLLGSLHRRDERPLLLVWQIALIYIFAGLNKAWEPDWRSGHFFDSWLGGNTEWYQWAAAYFPPRVFGSLMAWGTIIFEVTLGILVLQRRFRALAVWLSAAFHLGLFVFLGGATFGIFLHTAMIALLAFAPWDAGHAALSVPSRWAPAVHRFLPWLDHDDYFKIQSGTARWHLQLPNHPALCGWGAIRSTLLRLPVIWFGFACVFLLLPRFLSNATIHAVLSPLFVVSWLSFLPYESFRQLRAEKTD